ncbi:MAG: enoyl-CoA hydratase-related protein [Nitrososphaerales archaeon]
MDLETVRTESKNGVLWIGLNRPDRLNAFNGKMGSDLLEALQEGERGTETGCVVVTGEGGAFSVGEDLNTDSASEDSGKPLPLGKALMRKYNPIVQRIKKMEKPVIAGINGVTAGLGLGLALACDLRAASDKATFREAFVKAKLVPDPGTSFWLTRILGQARAMEVGLLGEPIKSTMALNLGLVNWVFADDRFEEEVANIAERLAKRPTRALGPTKRVLNRAIVVDVDSELEYEAYLQGLAKRRVDGLEGTGAFEMRDAEKSGQQGEGPRKPPG